MSNIVSLLPIIPAFESKGIYLVGDQQRQIAESWHQQDNNTLVHQYVPQSTGWPWSLVAYREGDNLLGFFTLTEYNLIKSIMNMPQVLTVVHRDEPGGVRVALEGMNLTAVQGDPARYAGTLFTGSLNFRNI